MRFLPASAPLLALVLFSATTAADDPTEGCASAIAAWNKGDLELALEEARWCVEGLEQARQANAAGSFKDSVAGFAGGDVENQRAMGMMMIGRSYEKDGAVITVSLAEAGGGANPMAALGTLAQMGMMGGGRKLRLHGHTATDMSDGGTAKLMVTPRGGDGFMNFESDDVDIEGVTGFARAFLEDFEF